MATKHTNEDRQRLGRAIKNARLRAGFHDIKDWADALGRSTRLLLGLERGEKVGVDTLAAVENVLRWRPGYTELILSDPRADLEPDIPRPAGERFEMPDEPRDLDAYTTQELLDEIATRYDELAMELHQIGRPTMTQRTEGNAEVWEPMSPEQRRKHSRQEENAR